MFGYAVNNLKKNKRKFAVVFSVIIVAVALILFALEIVSNLSKEMKIRAADSMAPFAASFPATWLSAKTSFTTNFLGLTRASMAS